MANKISETICPNCGSSNCKKNGHIHNGKQNSLCKSCGMYSQATSLSISEEVFGFF